MVNKLLSCLLFLFAMLFIVQEVEAAGTDQSENDTFSTRVASMAAIKNLRYNTGNGRIRIVLDVTKKIEYQISYLESPSRIAIDIDNAWIDNEIPREIEFNATAASKCRMAQFDKTKVRVVIETSAENNIFYLDNNDTGGRLVIDIGAGAENSDFAQKLNENNTNTSVRISKTLDEVDEPFKNESPKSETTDIGKVPSGIPSFNSDDKSNINKSKDKEKREKKSKKNKKDKKDSKSKEDVKDNKDNKEYIDQKLDELTGLEGKTIVIDPGHGGNDAGAIGPSGVMEKTVTLKVALALAKLLEDEGADVIMTRRTDVEVAPRGRHATDIEELKSRCDVANDAEADIFISIHADSFTNPAARGTTCYYFGEGAPESKKLAENIHPALIEQLKTPSRGTKPCNFYVVRNTDMPAILVELAFISNPQEEKLLNSKDGVEKAAQGILDGIEDYFG